MAAMVMAQIDLHQSAGRIDGVTRLPNRAQLADDLREPDRLPVSGPATMVLLDIIAHEQLQAAVRAVGIAPLEVVLRDVAARLRSHLPASARLYHVAETRFAFLLAGDDRAAHGHLVQALLLQMREPFMSGSVLVELQAQAGLAPCAAGEAGAADMLRQATSALYCANTGQHDFAWYTPDTDTRDRRAYAMLRDIPAALAHGELRLVYQPKLDLRTLKYAGVEALIRWQHPRHGNIAPVEFIPLAENTPIIHLITEWVLHTALAQLATWQRQGLALAVAVNVSARNLEHPGFLRMLRNACALHDIERGLLHIECTENAALTGRSTLGALQEVRAMGIQVSLDDFGTGYCNLACLHGLPAELLKLDQSLVRPIASDPRARALLQSVIALGQSLGYRLLAEGVETAEIFDCLVSAGCDAAQGYYLSRPLEPGAVPGFIETHDRLYAPARLRRFG
jgi:EAL domain-containing protein (putative c-di-GMP-specific phosphodiesterase class I)/GGDEF domain-containing protein